MNSVIITILSLGMLASTGIAQTEAKPEPKSEIRRMEPVTWDLMSHTLRWTVKKGTEVTGEFIPVAKVDDERRRFELQEAALLHRLLDTSSAYRDAFATPAVVAAKQEH